MVMDMIVTSNFLCVCTFKVYFCKENVTTIEYHKVKLDLSSLLRVYYNKNLDESKTYKQDVKGCEKEGEKMVQTIPSGQYYFFS